jgi:carbon monoxide dehydrogenase subunit G
MTFLGAGDITEVTCSASADAGGALAAVGSRLIQAAAVRMMERFFTTFVEDLRARRS